MSQNDFIIANQTAPNFRADLNDALQALASLSSGPSAPSTTYANMLWYDTAYNKLKMRTEANDAWIKIGYLDQTTNEFHILDDTLVVSSTGTQKGLIGNQTKATWEAGTSTTESLVSPSKVSAAIKAQASFAPAYESPEQDFANITTGITVNHGLGRKPYFWTVVLVCKVASGGYSVGDEIDVTNMVDGDGSRGYVSWANSTSISIVFDNASIQNTTADFYTPSASDFAVVFRAW